MLSFIEINKIIDDEKIQASTIIICCFKKKKKNIIVKTISITTFVNIWTLKAYEQSGIMFNNR